MDKKVNGRPGNFNEFVNELMKNEGKTENCNKYVLPRNQWITENKTKQILDKIPSDELPQCELIDVEHSKVGDFISSSKFEDTYDDKGEILDRLGDNGVLCYIFNDSQTWWETKQNKGKDGIDGLIRIR